MHRFSFPFLVLIYFVVTPTKNAGNGSFLEGFNGTGFVANVSIVDSVELLEEWVEEEEEVGRRCLMNVSRCYEEDDSSHTTTDILHKFLTNTMPPFDLRLPSTSPQCKKDTQQFLRDLRKFKFWALKMYDSSAKIPSGILNGNVNQLGDFDMCLSSQSENGIYGKYCLASMEIHIPDSPYLAGLHRLMQSHFHFKSKLEDPGHRVPRFGSINWALCVPNSCTPEDVKNGLETSVKKILQDTKIGMRFEVNKDMCQSRVDQKISFGSKVALAIFAGVILWELFATLYEVYSVGEPNKWITSFSYCKNIKKLFSLERSSGDIQTIHGIRFLNAVLLIVSHKSMAVFFTPYVNRTAFVEYLARPFSVIARAASLYTDPFIMISGLLTSYSLIGKLNRSGTLNIKEEYVSRLYRIVPTFAALIAFCTFILPLLGDGPMWNLVVTHHSDICKKYWWRNLLFIHNYFGFKNMCLTHTHHLGIDTQLFFTSPFMVLALWKWPKKATIALLALASVSTIARYYVTLSMKLSNYVHFGTSVQQLFDTADYMYILPPHRATVYIMGILMGYLLRKYSHITLSKVQLRMGNTLALTSFLVSYFGPAFMGKIDYMYNPIDAAWYAAFSPILWVGSFCWVIFTSQLGYVGPLGKLFAHPICLLWTRISYTVYLTQFPIFFFNVGVTRASEEYGFWTKMANFQEYWWIITLSILLTVVFEMPFQNVRDLMLKRTRKSEGEVKKVT